MVPSVTARFRAGVRVFPLTEIVRSATAQFDTPESRVFRRLSYTHFEQLIGLDSPEKRQFYEQHCLQGHWSVRELKRQIASLYYERKALSTDKAALELAGLPAHPEVLAEVAVAQASRLRSPSALPLPRDGWRLLP